MVHQSDVSARVDMCLEQGAVVRSVDHITRSDHNIGIADIFEDVHVLDVSGDICVIDIVYCEGLRI